MSESHVVHPGSFGPRVAFTALGCAVGATAVAALWASYRLSEPYARWARPLSHVALPIGALAVAVVTMAWTVKLDRYPIWPVTKKVVRPLTEEERVRQALTTGPLEVRLKKHVELYCQGRLGTVDASEEFATYLAKTFPLGPIVGGLEGHDPYTGVPSTDIPPVARIRVRGGAVIDGRRMTPEQVAKLDDDDRRLIFAYHYKVEKTLKAVQEPLKKFLADLPNSVENAVSGLNAIADLLPDEQRAQFWALSPLMPEAYGFVSFCGYDATSHLLYAPPSGLVSWGDVRDRLASELVHKDWRQQLSGLPAAQNDYLTLVNYMNGWLKGCAPPLSAELKGLIELHFKPQARLDGSDAQDPISTDPISDLPDAFYFRVGRIEFDLRSAYQLLKTSVGPVEHPISRSLLDEWVAVRVVGQYLWVHHCVVSKETLDQLTKPTTVEAVKDWLGSFPEGSEKEVILHLQLGDKGETLANILEQHRQSELAAQMALLANRLRVS